MQSFALIKFSSETNKTSRELGTVTFELLVHYGEGIKNDAMSYFQRRKVFLCNNPN